MTSAKPYSIAKRTVWEAYQHVKANRGAAGIDEETIAMFEQNLSGNLYKLWNRMSSGSYFPPPVKQVEIPKKAGGVRKLGVPTVADRIGQTVVKLLIEPILDPLFQSDSYGYRPGRSAKQAVAVTRKRCWQYDWLVEFDIKAAFDEIDHSLLMKAARAHIKEDWILLYIERWLTAPLETADGMRQPRKRGTPQGGVVSPILMNLSPVDLKASNLEDLLAEWQHYYNWDRPHGSLVGKTPIERLTDLADQTLLWEEVSAKFDLTKERLQEQSYRAELALRKLKCCP